MLHLRSPRRPRVLPTAQPSAARVVMSGTCMGLTLLAVAGGAQAQIVDWDLGFSVDGTYDDNLLRLSDEEDPDPGESRSDFVHAYGLNGEIGLNISRQRLFLTGAATIRRHVENTQLNTIPFAFNGGWEWEVYRCSGALSGLFREVTSEIDQLDDTALNTERTFGVQQTATCLLGSAFSVGVNSAYNQTTNSLATEDTDDRRRFAIDGFVGYEVPDLMSIEFGTSYQSTEFPNRAEGDVLPTQSDQFGLDLRVSRAFSPTFQVGGSVGTVIITGIDDPGPFPRFSLDIDWQVTPKIDLGLTGARTVDSPQTIDSALEINDSIELTADWDLTPKVELGSAVRLVHASFETAGDAGTLSEDREDLRVSTEVSVGYRPIEDLRLSLSYAFVDQDSSIDTSSFQSQRVSFGAALQF